MYDIEFLFLFGIYILLVHTYLCHTVPPAVPTFDGTFSLCLENLN